MKIIQLTASNVKRLKAVEITPDGTLQIVGGRNAQGKSSVLDAIWLALGGGRAGKETTLPIYIFSQLRFPKQIPMIMALGTCLVVASIVLLTIAEYFRRRGLAKTGAKDTGGFL